MTPATPQTCSAFSEVNSIPPCCMPLVPFPPFFSVNLSYVCAVYIHVTCNDV